MSIPDLFICASPLGLLLAQDVCKCQTGKLHIDDVTLNNYCPGSRPIPFLPHQQEDRDPRWGVVDCSCMELSTTLSLDRRAEPNRLAMHMIKIYIIYIWLKTLVRTDQVFPLMQHTWLLCTHNIPNNFSNLPSQSCVITCNISLLMD